MGGSGSLVPRPEMLSLTSWAQGAFESDKGRGQPATNGHRDMRKEEGGREGVCMDKRPSSEAQL